MCGTSLVFPKQSVLRISIRSTNSTSLTIIQGSVNKANMEHSIAFFEKHTAVTTAVCWQSGRQQELGIDLLNVKQCLYLLQIHAASAAIAQPV